MSASRRIAAARVFQSATPNALAISSRLWLMLILTPLVARAARRLCAMALASRKSRISQSLCLNEAGAPGACVTDPFVRAKGDGRPRYVHRTQRAQAAGRNHLRITWPADGPVSINRLI